VGTSARLDGHCPAGIARRLRGGRERLEEASRMNRMQQTTVCLVFLDSCGCDPTPRIHLRVEHPGWRSMAIDGPPVKRDLVAIANPKCETRVRPPGRLDHLRDASNRPGNWLRFGSRICVILNSKALLLRDLSDQKNWLRSRVFKSRAEPRRPPGTPRTSNSMQAVMPIPCSPDRRDRRAYHGPGSRLQPLHPAAIPTAELPGTDRSELRSLPSLL
jgi:hypothetical protein